MKTLYLLRHAHAANAAPLMDDHDRVLSPQGAKDAQAVGQFMREHKIIPDLVLSSSAARTTQTTRLIFSALFHKADAPIPGRFDRKLYLAPAEKILPEIQMADDSVHHLMIVGHNPGIGDLARALGNIESYAPGTLSVFKTDCRSWSEFSPEAAKLDKVFVP